MPNPPTHSMIFRQMTHDPRSLSLGAVNPVLVQCQSGIVSGFFTRFNIVLTKFLQEMTSPAGNAAGRGAIALGRGTEAGPSPSPSLSLGAPASRIPRVSTGVMQDRLQVANPPFKRHAPVEGQRLYMSCQGRQPLDPPTTSQTHNQANRN
jgi:hypothetical protein